ncbi:MAG: anthranilate synthase component I family protein [Aquificae bacterium]|nr:anthranilate synthase component I family protein [Aquificota bacterium]
MRLLLWGRWLGEERPLRARVKKVHRLYSLSELPAEPPLSFVILSYSLSEETLGIPVKNEGETPIMLAELEDFEEYRPKKGEVRLRFKGSSLSDKDFKDRVRRIKEYIERGDVYQLNLTCAFSFEFEGSPEHLFTAYYGRQPVPYAFLFEEEDFFLISGSMELFLEKRGRRLVSKPIKGTSRNPKYLKESEKERAENLMITDMMRNDIGRVAETGSVRVKELFRVEAYRTLYHMHSTVVGETEKNLREILGATFPPASVTGAPKKRSVEIIEELEPHPRTYYCGAAGLIFPNGNFTLSVLIRTAIGRGSEIRYYAGCGIVWDSEEERELEELRLKVKAFTSLPEGRTS